jgi:hypothetical protein
MKRVFCWVVFLILALLPGGCSKSPYKILDRQTEQQGLVVKVRPEVTSSATQAQLEGPCAEISENEKGDGLVVTVEFLEEGAVVRQKALCAQGKVYMN